MKLKRQDWIERSPNQGDLFFNLWTELLQKSHETGADTARSPPNSPRKGTKRKSSPPITSSDTLSLSYTKLHERYNRYLVPPVDKYNS